MGVQAQDYYEPDQLQHRFCDTRKISRSKDRGLVGCLTAQHANLDEGMAGLEKLDQYFSLKAKSGTCRNRTVE